MQRLTYNAYLYRSLKPNIFEKFISSFIFHLPQSLESGGGLGKEEKRAEREREREERNLS
jgi:hypothetical protein